MLGTIGITLGDPAGVGPEVVQAALASGKLDARFSYRLIGSSDGVTPGMPCEASARAAVSALEEAARLAVAGEIDAVVTGPIHKARSQAVGFSFPGQTEFFAARAGVENYAMLLTGGALTVALVTAHVPLSLVPSLVTGSEIERVGSLLAEFVRLRSSGSEPVRIAVSFDNLRTWTVLADSAASKGILDWTIPSVSSTVCYLTLSGVSQNEPWDVRGPFTIDATVPVADVPPRVLGLLPNSPNPFNPSTTISFTLPAPENISLSIYDVTGRKVTELERGFFAVGEHTVVWNASGCASGVYFCVLRAGNAVETRKMLLMR